MIPEYFQKIQYYIIKKWEDKVIIILPNYKCNVKIFSQNFKSNEKINSDKCSWEKFALYVILHFSKWKLDIFLSLNFIIIILCLNKKAACTISRVLSFIVFHTSSNMKYVTYNRSVVESKIAGKEKPSGEKGTGKEEREKALRTTGISYRSRVGISEPPYSS